MCGCWVFIAVVVAATMDAKCVVCSGGDIDNCDFFYVLDVENVTMAANIALQLSSLSLDTNVQFTNSTRRINCGQYL